MEPKVSETFGRLCCMLRAAEGFTWWNTILTPWRMFVMMMTGMADFGCPDKTN